MFWEGIWSLQRAAFTFCPRSHDLNLTLDAKFQSKFMRWIFRKRKEMSKNLKSYRYLTLIFVSWHRPLNHKNKNWLKLCAKIDGTTLTELFQRHKPPSLRWMILRWLYCLVWYVLLPLSAWACCKPNDPLETLKITLNLKWAWDYTSPLRMLFLKSNSILTSQVTPNNSNTIKPSLAEKFSLTDSSFIMTLTSVTMTTLLEQQMSKIQRHGQIRSV